MLTLDLSNDPSWYDLAPGERVRLRPLTTALMPDAASIDTLMDVWPIFEAFQSSYVSKDLLLEQEKRLRARAEWSFGEGERYCATCTQACEDCPARLNAPLTVDGWQVWDLVQRLGGQLRASGRTVIGWGMGAALALGAALGIPPLAVAELLPAVEAAMVAKINEQMDT